MSVARRGPSVLDVAPLGDDGLRAPLPLGVDPGAALDALRALPGVRDVALTEAWAAVFFDPDGPVPDVASALRRVPAAGAIDRPPVEVPVRYDGPDLDAVAAWAGLSPADVAAAHAGRTYAVRYLGFLPGFAYLGDVDPRIAAPRRSPRPRVPAGAVGIAGPRTGIYPSASPGGWNLVGTVVGFVPFDPVAGARLRPGDRVRFVPA